MNEILLELFWAGTRTIRKVSWWTRRSITKLERQAWEIKEQTERANLLQLEEETDTFS
jgi:hypothetical protein